MSNNSSVSHSSNVPHKKGELIENSKDTETVSKPFPERDDASMARDEKLSDHSLRMEVHSRLPEASGNNFPQETEKRIMSASCNHVDSGVEELKTVTRQGTRETVSTDDMLDIGSDSRMTSEVSGIDRNSTHYLEEDNLDGKDYPRAYYDQTGQHEDSMLPHQASPTHAARRGHDTSMSPVALLEQAVPLQHRYLRRDEYLAVVMTCTLADLTNPPNPTMQEAFAHGKYEHLLGYANALDDAGQISNAQEVIILATAQCFRPLGLLQEVDQHFELTANILKHCHSLARGRLLRFLQTMLDRAPAAFMPRGEAFIPILDGFAAVLESYAEVVPLASRTRYKPVENCNEVLERWRVERENAGLTMGILQWLARQPAHWASLNGSRMLLISLAGLVTEPSIDRAIHGMIIDYIALNHEYLPCMDVCIPENVILDTIVSTVEHALGREITSLQYPEYMIKLRLNGSDAEIVLAATLTILYHYSGIIPRESMVLARFADSLSDFIVADCGTKYRPAICHTIKRLFERFPEEFEVDEKFVKALGRMWADEHCREQAMCMMQIIQERCRDEGHTT